MVKVAFSFISILTNQLALLNQSITIITQSIKIDLVLYKHHFEFPINKKIIPE